jgi:taurine transport system substrate-binding protein
MLTARLVRSLARCTAQWLIFISSGLGGFGLPAYAQERQVVIGYQEIATPWKSLIDSKELEEMTGYKITWKLFQTGAEVAKALSEGQIQIGELGSSPLANALTNGVGIELFWITNGITDAEALVVRNDSGIKTWEQLAGKTVGVPNLSTSHYQLFTRLAKDNRLKFVTIKPMKPAEIKQAWIDKKIDAAFVWDPVLAYIKESGTVLMTAGDIAKKGYPTFDAMAISRRWGSTNEKFVSTLVQALLKTHKDYAENSAKWVATTPELQKISKYSGTNTNDTLIALKQYKFLSADEQLSSAWLGAGAPRALQDTAFFIFATLFGKVPLPSYTEFVNTSYLKTAQSSSSVATLAPRGAISAGIKIR